jgi:hypothetical protein
MSQRDQIARMADEIGRLLHPVAGRWQAVVETDQAQRVRQASAYLRELLTQSGQYRSTWVRRADQVRPGKINIDAVARVIADYLTVHGDDSTTHRAKNDTVKRAIEGTTLTAKTLNAFIGAFEIGGLDAQRLLGLLDGTSANVIIGDLPPMDGGVSRRPDAQPLYKTIQLHEFHYLGADGQPSHHRTVQEIRALVDGFTTHRYVFDTNEVVVERVLGGQPGEPYQFSGSNWAVDLTLPRTLNAGDSAALEYVTRFQYKEVVEPCVRRVAHQRIENLSMRVEFHPERLPRSVWWAEWQDYRPPNDAIVSREPVELDAEYAVERRLDILERAVAGFMWKFEVQAPADDVGPGVGAAVATDAGTGRPTADHGA